MDGTYNVPDRDGSCSTQVQLADTMDVYYLWELGADERKIERQVSSAEFEDVNYIYVTEDMILVSFGDLFLPW